MTALKADQKYDPGRATAWKWTWWRQSWHMHRLMLPETQWSLARAWRHKAWLLLSHRQASAAGLGASIRWFTSLLYQKCDERFGRRVTACTV